VGLLREQCLPMSVASTSLYLVPVFGILIAALFLGERLAPVTIAATAVVLFAIIAIMRWDKSAV
jgi:drug/metabolite transporter (DMT)-like permease